MKNQRYVVKLLAILVFAMVMQGCSQGPWLDYNSSEWKFSASFPGTPKITTKTDDKGNNVKIVTTTFAIPQKYGFLGAKYTVIVSDIQAPNLDTITFDENAALQGAREGVKSEGGTIQTERKVEENGLNGWEFEVTSSNTASTLRMFRKNFTIYVLEVARAKGKSYEKERKNFFGSFKIE